MNPPDAPTRKDDARTGAVDRRSLEDRRRSAAASVIERAGFTTDAAPDLRVARNNPVLALIHDGSDAAILSAVQAGLGQALPDAQLLLAVHTIASADDASAGLRAFLRRHRPHGVVLVPPYNSREDLALLCVAARVRCIRLGAIEADSVVGIVDIAIDERRATRDLVGWLITQGHVRIGFVAGPDGSPSAQQRELGYLDAMADSGLDRGPALIVPGDNSFASGIEAARLLLEISPRPTAICASNDAMAAGVLHAAARAGVAVPSELSVAGIDDAPLAAQVLPPLTTMHIPWAVMGREAGRHVATPGTIAAAPGSLVPRLIMRDSVRSLT